MGSKGGSERITITDNVGQGSNQPCKMVVIMPASGNSGTVRVNIDDVCTATTGIPVAKHAADAGNYLVVYVENLLQLHFYGTADDDIVDLLWMY